MAHGPWATLYYLVFALGVCRSSDALFVAGPSGSNYDDAVAYCASIGAEIATIYSATENELARKACGGSSCWIGLEEAGGDASTPFVSQQFMMAFLSSLPL